MPLPQRLTAEFIGTLWLVLGGCGSAVLAAAFPGLGIGFVGVSLAFGLTVLTMAYRGTSGVRVRATGDGRGATHFSPHADDIGFMRLDREFNTLLAVACRNEFAAAAIELFAGLSRRFWYFNYRRYASLPKVAHLHAAVARAVAKGDEEGARRASNTLIDHIAEFTSAAVAP